MRNDALLDVMVLVTLLATPSPAAARDGARGWHPEFEAARRELFDAIPEDAGASAAAAGPAAEEPAAPACALRHVGSEAMTAQRCLECHAGTGGRRIRSTHPVGAYRWRPGLRTPDEVVRRGVLLPNGAIECVTCHDRRSPWKDHVALPPGAPAVAAVDARDPASLQGRPSWREARARAARPPDGSAVSPAPLCAACHTHAD
ncbi:MAG TPA: hypothetical protein VIV57_01685 [Anaeromyxobacter sp.]